MDVANASSKNRKIDERLRDSIANFCDVPNHSDEELRFMYENGQGHLTLFCIVFV